MVALATATTLPALRSFTLWSANWRAASGMSRRSSLFWKTTRMAPPPSTRDGSPRRSGVPTPRSRQARLRWSLAAGWDQEERRRRKRELGLPTPQQPQPQPACTADDPAARRAVAPRGRGDRTGADHKRRRGVLPRRSAGLSGRRARRRTPSAPRLCWPGSAPSRPTSSPSRSPIGGLQHTTSASSPGPTPTADQLVRMVLAPRAQVGVSPTSAASSPRQPFAPTARC